MNSKHFFQQVRLFGKLLKTDFFIFKQNCIDDIIDTCVWVTFCTIVAAYVLPSLGMQVSYGAFFLIGCIGSSSIFLIFGDTSQVVADLHGERTITYPLTLPIPGWLLFVQKAVTYSLQAAIISAIIIPLGKLILMERFNLSLINPFRFIIIYLSLHVFCAGFFTLFFVSMTEKMSRILNIWTRVLFPLWFMGGSQFSWQTLDAMNPWFAKLCLLNPFTYAFEALHAATLGQEGYLPFWLCIMILWASIVLFGFISIKRLQKRLDFI